MPILVVDDERNFKFDAVYVRDTYAAGRLLTANHYCQVWLDNDLGGNEEVYNLAKEIERAAVEDGVILDVNEFVIHTQNPIARNRIYEALRKHYQVRIVVDLKPYLI